MRWLVAILGMIGLAGGVYLGLQPRLSRPALRVALNLKAADPDDAALAAGVDLALDERDFRAGRFRVKTAHQTVQPNGIVRIPRPCAHTMLYGMENPGVIRVGTELFMEVGSLDENTTALDWLKSRDLRKVWQPLRALESYRAPKRPVRRFDPNLMAVTILETGPDAIILDRGSHGDLVPRLRSAGFDGPIFVSANVAMDARLEGCFRVLAPVKPPPADFLRRHPHPFAYVGYRGMLRYLDALDANPQAEPLAQARYAIWGSAFDVLFQNTPRVYRFQGGALHPVPPK